MQSWQDLDLNQPINWAHPLNRGRVAWWLTVPGRYGAPTWWDLAKGYAGALTSFGSGYGWNAASNPGGAGSILLNSSGSNRVDFGNQSWFYGATGCSWCFSFRLNASTAGRLLIQWGNSLSAQLFDFEIVTGPLRLQVAFYSGSPGGYYIATTPTLTVGKWYRCVITFAGSPSGVKCWLNGQSQTLTQSASSPFNNLVVSSSANIQLGYETGSGTNSANFSANDISFYPSRVLTQADVAADYLLSQEWYRDVLNWLSSDLLLFPPSSGTSLALAAQSAAWTNPTLTQLSALPLGQESAAWTDPALSLASLLSLAAESAAWTDPAIALSSSLALAAESASWTNPALAQALALALSQQSASWTNPALTIPGSSLSLAAQSAAWANPALSFASSLALAAESASWTNPALNAALVLALTGQSAAWSNAALTPSGSQGIVLQVPAQSATWAVGPLGLFFCPTIVNPYFGLEWLVVVPGLPALAQESCVISNTEVVTLYRKRGDGSFDGGTLIGQALRLDDHKALIGGGKGLLKRNELQWYLWKSQTGAPEVKDGDVIQDAFGNRWTVWNTDVQAWGNRFFVQTKLENVNLQ